MSRPALLIWPALVLVVSFLAVFGVSHLLATDRQPVAPQATVTTTVTATPAAPATSPVPGKVLTLTVSGGDLEVPGVLVQNGGQRCLDPNFSKVWTPDAADIWMPADNAQCLRPGDWTKTDLVLTFRAR